ncbi:hypothetical protein AB1Y20_017349 [Prymnesium parvum]|uniref:Uncharacterized protein n=1 Tax=Prymnesium parvum TaxID=97485 RepID=A0AB34JM78_PRYPA
MAEAALCLVGELRSFAMPLVHMNIARAAREWRADVFVVYHTRYDAAAMAHAHRGRAISCVENVTAMALLQPKATVRWRAEDAPCPKLRHKSSLQFAQVERCFALASRHAAARGAPYEWYVRLRPDFAVLQHAALPRRGWAARLGGRADERVHFGWTKPDFAFALSHAGMVRFCAEGRKRLLPCARKGVDPSALEWAHPGFFGAPSWPLGGGLVRSDRFIDQFGQPAEGEKTARGNRRSEGFLRALTEEEVLAQRCETAGEPALRAADRVCAPRARLLRLGARHGGARRLEFVEADAHPSERYSSALRCGGHGYLFSRRADGETRADDLFRWRTVVRRQWSASAYGAAQLGLASAARLSHNAHFLCAADGTTLLAIGGRFRPSAGERGLRVLASASGWPLVWRRRGAGVRGDHRGCAERRRTVRIEGRDVPTHGACEFDGRVGAVEHGGALLVYTRANLHADGGARHVQVTRREAGGWARFEEVRLENYTVSRENNIYFFVVQRFGRALLAAFPAVIGGEGGIFWAASRDGVHWSPPSLLMPSRAVAGRTADHPVRWKFDEPLLNVTDDTSGPAFPRRVELHVEHQVATIPPPKGTKPEVDGPFHCVYELNATRLVSEVRAALRSPWLRSSSRAA